ncbi:MAG: hypothetical protein ACLQUY_25295 [Ktedonobacterales bacterium]
MLTYHNWSAVLSYAGVGSWDNNATCCQVVEWLIPYGFYALTFDDCIEAIRTRGSQWLSEMRQGQPQLSFVVGAFVSGKPQVVLISNFESLGTRYTAQKSQIRPELSVSKIMPRKPRIRVTGQTQAVTRTDKKLLLVSLRQGYDQERVRRLLADVHERAFDKASHQQGERLSVSQHHRRFLLCLFC